MASFSQSFEGSLAVKRGPHHPRGDTRRVDQHLTHEEQWVKEVNMVYAEIYNSLYSRIDDDLKEMGIQANLEDMSEEEKIFYMFKVV